MTARAPLPSKDSRSWRALARHFAEIGLDGAYLAKALRGGERLDDALRAPMRKWHMRARREPAAYAARLIVLDDVVSEAEAREALGAEADGLVEQAADGVRSPFKVTIASGMYFLSDAAPGEGAVLGPSANTLDLVRAARPASRVSTLADVGTGCGAAALLLADAAARIVASDIDPRAVAFTRINSMMNGVENVEARLGDRTSPLGDERFDVLVSHPPFLAGDGSRFAYGGARGDELALSLLAGIPLHLAERGTATLVLDWPIVSGDAVDARARRALAHPSFDLLIVESPGKNLDEHCTFHAAAEHRALGPAFEAAAMAQRERLARLGIVDLRTALTVVAPAPAGRAGFTDTVRVRHFSDAPPGAAQIARLMRARDLLARGDDALAAARLRIPPGTRFDAVAGAYVARLPEDRLVPAATLGEEALAAAHARDAGSAAPPSVVRTLLRTGVLEVDHFGAQASA